MASAEDVELILAKLHEVIDLDFEKEQQALEILARGEVQTEWDLDREVEDLKDKNPDELWQLLGIDSPSGQEKRIPGMAAVHDPGKQHTLWTQEGREFLATVQEQPRNLHWHQQVGLLKMAKWLVDGNRGICLDEVGVGKTLQVIALAAYRRVLIESEKTRHGGLGIFSECCLRNPGYATAHKHC